jgi:hypothetical protein
MTVAGAGFREHAAVSCDLAGLTPQLNGPLCRLERTVFAAIRAVLAVLSAYVVLS